MGTTTAPRPWDLGHLQQFLPDFSDPVNDNDSHAITHPADVNRACHDGDDADGLGDFSRIYTFLGPQALIASSRELESIPFKDDYVSDGAVYQPSGLPQHHASSPAPTVGMDRVDAVLAFDQSDSVKPDDSNVANAKTKKQRKRARYQERKAMLAAQRSTLSESECDFALGKETPASKASSHGMSTRSMSEKTQNGYATPSEQAIKAVAEAAARQKDEGDTAPETPCPTKPYTAKPLENHPTKRHARGAAGRLPAHSGTDGTGAVVSAPQFGPLHTVKTHDPWPPTQEKQDSGPPFIVKTHNPWPSPAQPKQDNGSPYIVKTHNLIPSSILPSPSNRKPDGAAQTKTPPNLGNVAAPTPTIKPITLRSGEDREMSLFFKILNDFGSDRKHLVRPSNLTTHNSDPTGIHVFVDASNIFIGFVDQLKRARGIHPRQRVPDVNLSFDSLALLIERRRPVAKRVLVGSTPHIAAFDTAKAVGYEVSVLEKVMKARELTERGIYFKELDDRRSGRKSSTKPPPHKIALKGSVLTPVGSETTTAYEPQFTPVSLVEQGVDEILHLKMMESVLDAETPGIMVLATGDAAQAEYSSGFMAMVERALRKGWTVELTSWAKNVNSLYRHKAWTAAWGERFRIIELDSYAEELLDM